jgi:TctA family transporter
VVKSLQFLLNGFAMAATPINLLFALIGVIVGTAVGVLPGVGPAMTIALLPITYKLSRPGQSSCWPASSTAGCTAGRPHRSC